MTLDRWRLDGLCALITGGTKGNNSLYKVHDLR